MRIVRWTIRAGAVGAGLVPARMARPPLISIRNPQSALYNPPVANRITVLRLLLLFLLVVWICRAPGAWPEGIPAGVLLVFGLDWLDGFAARRRGEESVFGAAFDIAADRITENVLWITAAALGQAPVWVPIVFVTRGFLVDLVRGAGAAAGIAPFDQMRTPLGRLLVSSPPVRFGYGCVKALAFAWIFRLHALPDAATPAALAAREILTGTAVVLCLLRGLPVLAEAALLPPADVRESTPRHQDTKTEDIFSAPERRGLPGTPERR